MLEWARRNRAAFYTGLWSKMVRPRGQHVEEVDDRTPKILALIEEVSQEYL